MAWRDPELRRSASRHCLLRPAWAVSGNPRPDRWHRRGILAGAALRRLGSLVYQAAMATASLSEARYHFHFDDAFVAAPSARLLAIFRIVVRARCVRGSPYIAEYDALSAGMGAAGGLRSTVPINGSLLDAPNRTRCPRALGTTQVPSFRGTHVDVDLGSPDAPCSRR